MKKSYIWSLPTRVFHLLFALFILIAFLTDDDKLLKYHAIAGYSILILLVFRVYWGYFGPKYSLLGTNLQMGFFPYVVYNFLKLLIGSPRNHF